LDEPRAFNVETRIAVAADAGKKRPCIACTNHICNVQTRLQKRQRTVIRMQSSSFDSPAAAEPDQTAQPLTARIAGEIRQEPAEEKLTSASNVKLEISLSLPGTSPSPAAPAVATRVGADKKLEYLDGLRGIMCLIVLCDHWLMMGYYNRPASVSADANPFFGYSLTRSPLRILVAGEFAVATFFVLRCSFPHSRVAICRVTHDCSGFVLCNRFVNGKAGDISLAEGAIRRFPRIMIPSAFAALLYWSILHWSPLNGRVCHQVVHTLLTLIE
jgi:hypothetical protein